ncbi:hypothetical protein D3C79_195000 [compost metagenome]
MLLMFTVITSAFRVALFLMQSACCDFNFNVYKDIVMKKINLSEAGKIIGGTFACSNNFEWVGSGSSKTCNLVTVCADKFGNVKRTYRSAPVGSCSALAVTPN